MPDKLKHLQTTNGKHEAKTEFGFANVLPNAQKLGSNVVNNAKDNVKEKVGALINAPGNFFNNVSDKVKGAGEIVTNPSKALGDAATGAMNNVEYGAKWTWEFFKALANNAGGEEWAQYKEMFSNLLTTGVCAENGNYDVMLRKAFMNLFKGSKDAEEKQWEEDLKGDKDKNGKDTFKGEKSNEAMKNIQEKYTPEEMLDKLNKEGQLKGLTEQFKNELTEDAKKQKQADLEKKQGEETPNTEKQENEKSGFVNPFEEPEQKKDTEEQEEDNRIILEQIGHDGPNTSNLTNNDNEIKIENSGDLDFKEMLPVDVNGKGPGKGNGPGFSQ